MRRRTTFCIAAACLASAPAASAASLAETKFLIRTIAAALEGSALMLAAFGLAFFLAGAASRKSGWSAILAAMLAVGAAGLGYALFGAGLGDVGAGGVIGFPAHIVAPDAQISVGVVPEGRPAAGADWAAAIALAGLSAAAASDAAFDRERVWMGALLGAVVGAAVFPIAHAWTTSTGWIGSLGAPAPSPILSALWVGAVAALAARVALGRDVDAEAGPARRRTQRAALSALGVVLAAVGLVWAAAWAQIGNGRADGADALGVALAHGLTSSAAGFMAGAAATAVDSRERARSLDGLLAGAVFFTALGPTAPDVGFGWALAGGALSGAASCVLGPALDRIGLPHPPRGVGLLPALAGAGALRAVHDGAAAAVALGFAAQALAAAAVAGLLGVTLAASGVLIDRGVRASKVDRAASPAAD